LHIKSKIFLHIDKYILLLVILLIKMISQRKGTQRICQW